MRPLATPNGGAVLLAVPGAHAPGNRPDKRPWCAVAENILLALGRALVHNAV